MRISLRWQIFLWYALAIPFIIFGMAYTSQKISVEGLRTAIDQRLQDRSGLVANTIFLNPRAKGGYERLIQRLTEQDLPYVPAVLRIADPTRKVLASFGEVPEPLLVVMDYELTLPEIDEGRFETIPMRGRDAIRLYTLPVRDPSTRETIALIQTGDSLAPLAASQEQLWRYTLIVGVGGSALALAVGLMILRRGFRPLDKILSRMREIGGRNLSIRIPDESRPRELQQLADTLNDVLQQLDTVFRTREAFFASVSHDLRTPLTVVQGQVEVLLNSPSVGQDTKRSLEITAKEIRRLTRMTNNLLLSAQLETSSVFTAGDVDLRELLVEVAREIRSLAHDVILTVSTPDIIVVPGDYDMIKQMVLNVVDNAVKFTPRGGTVALTLSGDDRYAIITVSDNGPGISPENLARIGSPFFRAGAGSKSKRGGTGLGLFAAKRVIGIHGGEMDVNSHEGVGTTVTIRLPLKAGLKDN